MPCISSTRSPENDCFHNPACVRDASVNGTVLKAPRPRRFCVRPDEHETFIVAPIDERKHITQNEMVVRLMAERAVLIIEARPRAVHPSGNQRRPRRRGVYRVPLQAGDIVVGDRAYARAPSLEKVVTAGADVIAHSGWRTMRIVTPVGYAIDWNPVYTPMRISEAREIGVFIAT